MTNNSPVASPRSALLNISTMIPPVLVIAELPQALVRNLSTNNDVTLPAHTAPMPKPVYSPNESTYTALRPYTSDSGAQRSGPNAKPSTNSERPSVATGPVKEKSRLMSGIPGAYAELAKVSAKVERECRIAMVHLRREDVASASSGS